MEQASHVTSLEEIIEKSKSHWSQLGDFDSNNEVAEVSNMELFKTLQAHPTWGSFFRTFGKGKRSLGELVMGEKYAEGGQAEIYEVQVNWRCLYTRKFDKKQSREFVLKVFKKGTFLRNLQSQWPQGMLKHYENQVNCRKLGLSLGVRRLCHVWCGTLLEDGRFAFLMIKEEEDLRNVINKKMLTRSNNEGPFSNKEALAAMYEVAFGMNQLHNRGIVHRDIKASNVLASPFKVRICYVNMSLFRIYFIADFECSVGVVGTGFWRAPEILEACKYGTVNTKAELFTKAADVYSYGMICYEILTGKLPFEGHPLNDYDLVLQGQRPELPNYVDGWIQQLLTRCWQPNPIDRPTFQEILKTLQANSTICRIRGLTIQINEAEFKIRATFNYRNSKIVEMWRSLRLKLGLPKQKRLCSCRKCRRR